MEMQVPLTYPCVRLIQLQLWTGILLNLRMVETTSHLLLLFLQVSILKLLPLLVYIRKYRLNNADWELLNQRVEQKTNIQVQTGNQISGEILTNALIEDADETFCTKAKNRSLIPSPPWWDHERTSAIKARRQAEKRYCNEITEENFELYLESVFCSVVQKNYLKKRNKIVGNHFVHLLVQMSTHRRFGEIFEDSDLRISLPLQNYHYR